jgi:hypothetical protein
MNSIQREQLALLRSQQWFNDLITEIVDTAPTISAHDPKDPLSAEKWKANSASRGGYFLCLTRLGYKLENLKGDKDG